MEKGRKKKNSLWSNAMKRFRRNKRAMAGLVVVILLIFIAVFAPLIAPYGYDDQNIVNAFISPGKDYWFGTDNLGRDVFSRLIYGARISLSIGFIATAISAFFGTVIGACAGYYGGRTDDIIMRCVDIVQSIPSILLAIVIATTLGSGIGNCMVAVGISAVPSYARIMRGTVLSVREMEYVEAARSVTAGDRRIIFKHIIPNVMSPLIVNMTMGYASAILTAASLSFIGLGAQPPSPEWGAMITAGKQYILQYPYLITGPGVVIMVTVIALNLLGDGIRDALDPKMKQ